MMIRIQFHLMYSQLSISYMYLCSQYKCTALHHASTNQQKAIVKLLCDAGADLNLQCDIVSPI